MQSHKQRLFGTDGVRGRAGEGWLTADAVSALGRAVGEVLAEQSDGPTGGRALLGHDGRRSGPELEAALARGLRAAGLEPASAGLITTPGLATVARLGGARVALMVSASHNPAGDNGIKLFTGAGDKLDDRLEAAVEARWRERPEPVREGRPALHDPQLEQQYFEHLLGAAGELDLTGLAVVVDCANGGASRVTPRVLGRLGARVTAIASEPDGENINAGCGSTHPARLIAEVRARGAALGIALDGDGDRCLMVDERGELVDGDALLTLLTAWRVERGHLGGGRIVATVMSNKGLYRALRELGVGVVTVDVGDRRVVEAMRREGLELGGEPSGHVVFGPENHFVGDGTLTALRVLEVLRAGGKSLSELAGRFRAFPQVLVNVPVLSKPAWSDLPEVGALVAEVERELGDDGRVLLRYSGTEALARVMVEGPELDWIQARAQAIAQSVGRAIGAPGA